MSAILGCEDNAAEAAQQIPSANHACTVREHSACGENPQSKEDRPYSRHEPERTGREANHHEREQCAHGQTRHKLLDHAERQLALQIGRRPPKSEGQIHSDDDHADDCRRQPLHHVVAIGGRRNHRLKERESHGDGAGHGCGDGSAAAEDFAASHLQSDVSN